ncbi:hypothetical protein HK105_208530 [Polyrhizophydium stewartii]|uniref:Uncharacterized protein n=1 Tax=Polyrhizophydium stewartii TaxID=2732419 RepID=A0ABR4MXH6_9FUNG
MIRQACRQLARARLTRAAPPRLRAARTRTATSTAGSSSGGSSTGSSASSSAAGPTPAEEPAELNWTQKYGSLAASFVLFTSLSFGMLRYTSLQMQFEDARAEGEAELAAIRAETAALKRELAELTASESKGGDSSQSAKPSSWWRWF